MVSPALHAVPLALGAAVSPALVAVTVDLLATGGARRRIEVLSYLIGVRPSLGVALLVLAARLVTQRLRHRAPDGVRPPATTGSNARLVGLGVAMMVTNVSTILLFSVRCGRSRGQTSIPSCSSTAPCSRHRSRRSSASTCLCGASPPPDVNERWVTSAACPP